MNIGFDAKRALNNHTGLGVYSRNLMNALFQHYPEESYHLFSASINEDLLAELKGVFSIHTPQTALNEMFPALWRSYGVVKDLNANQIQVYHGLSNEIPVFRTKAKYIKKVVTIHDLIFLKEQQQYPFIDRQIYKAKVGYACKHADVIVATSEQTKKDLVHYFRVAEKRIRVVYQNCDNRFFAPASAEEKQAIQQKYNLPAQCILNVSSFYPRKNQAALIKAFASISAKTNHHLLLIGGNESERGKCERLVEDLQLTKRVMFLSNIPASDMPVIYKLADLFVYPSFFEGFGIPIVEALASGVSVLCSDIPCFREVGREQVRYFDPNDAIALGELIMLELQKREVNNVVGETVKRFTSSAFAEEMISVYTG
jgi:glycosyltransferase involved in cell wall biosynthesis